MNPHRGGHGAAPERIDMNEPKWTKGPWRLIQVIGACSVYAGERQVLAYSHSPDAENRANATLIATSPDLYAELTQCVAMLRQYAAAYIIAAGYGAGVMADPMEFIGRTVASADALMARARGEA